MEKSQQILSEADLLMEQKEKIKKTKGVYRYPFPEDTELSGIEINIESHEGPYEGAIDFIVPLRTEILAARKGTVVAAQDIYTKSGPTREFAPYLNYITLQHTDGEFSQYCHLAQFSSRVNIGDQIEEGILLGVTGKSGWMDKPHLHFFVFELTGENKFVGLRPQFKDFE